MIDTEIGGRKKAITLYTAADNASESRAKQRTEYDFKSIMNTLTRNIGVSKNRWRNSWKHIFCISSFVYTITILLFVYLPIFS